jgi:hypothetical protein
LKKKSDLKKRNTDFEEKLIFLKKKSDFEEKIGFKKKKL